MAPAAVEAPATAARWTGMTLLDPRPEDFSVEEIAAGLAATFRFHGQSPLSVAQHSVLLARAAKPEHAVAALFHDAGEAYLCDLPTPVKYAPGFSAFRRLEDRYLAAMAERFDFEHPLPREIKALDRRLLRAECEALLPPGFAAQVAPRVRPLDVEIEPWTPGKAQRLFLAQARLLGVD